jgi:hypothetical protein
LNFIVHDIDAAVAALGKSRIKMEHYPQTKFMKQDNNGIARDPQGPAIAWFKDNAGNTLGSSRTRQSGSRRPTTAA